MKQPEKHSTKVKMVIILVCVVFILFLLGTGYFFLLNRQSTHQKEILKTLSVSEKESFSSITGYLDELDQEILANQSYLSTAALLQTDTAKQLTDLSDSLQILENYLLKIETSIHDQDSTSSQYQKELYESIQLLTEHQIGIIESIQLSQDSITWLLSVLSSNLEEQYSSTIEKLENLSTSLLEINSRLTDYQKELKTFAVSIQDEQKAGQKELLEDIQETRTYIEKLFSEHSLYLDTMFQENFLILGQKLDSIHLQIAGTKEFLDQTLSLMEGNAENRHELLTESFHEVFIELGSINTDINSANSEIQNLISTLTADASRNHKETLDLLNDVSANIQESSQQNLSAITASLQEIQNNFGMSLSSLQTELNNALLSLDSDKLNALNQSSTSIDSRLSMIQNTMDTQYTLLSGNMSSGDNRLMEYLKNIMQDVNRNLEQVFTYVSDGKSMLASALLTKGVECRQDATFSEIYQAILSIPQKTVIGVEELPGEISYEYHYHIDSNGQLPHAAQVSQKGGCYTAPLYHSHTGDSANGGGCYTIPVMHTHVSNCYTVTKIERKILGFSFTGQGTGHACCDNSHGQNWARFSYEDNEYRNGVLISSTRGQGELGYCCDLCVNRKASEHGYSNTNSIITCGYSEGLNRYDLSCGMTTSTIFAYRPECGLGDGQITAAHILYPNRK